MQLIISFFLEVIFGYKGSLEFDNTWLSDGPDAFSAGTYSLVTTLNDTVMKPIAASILAIMLALEFVRITSRYEGDQKTGTQQVALAIFKVALLVMVVQNSNLILEAITSIGQTFNSGVQAASGVNVASIVSGTHAQSAVTYQGGAAAVWDALKAAIDVVNPVAFVKGILLIIILLIIMLVTLASRIAVVILVFMRFAEIYVLAAGSALPIAFIAHPETKAIGVGYLRKFGAVIMQGAVIVIVLAVYALLYPQLVPPGSILLTVDIDDMFSTIIDNIAGLLGAPALLLVMLVSSSRFARAFVGE